MKIHKHINKLRILGGLRPPRPPAGGAAPPRTPLHILRGLRPLKLPLFIFESTCSKINFWFRVGVGVE